MTRLKSTQLGYYIPAFFEMHVAIDSKDMTIKMLSLEDITVLFHEYIHFLQDFTTYYGLNNIYCYSEYIHAAVTHIYSQNESFFDVPFILPNSDDNVFLNMTIAKLTMGDNLDKSIINIQSIEESSDQLPQNNFISSIPSITITFKDGDIATFGAMAILESMAFIMERLCSPKGYKDSPNFPYMSAEQVADFYVPDFSGDLLKVLALCDMSLMSSNPGKTFVMVMKGIQKKELSFNRPEEIYDHFYNQISIVACSQKTTLTDQFLLMLSVVEESLKSYIKIKDSNIQKSYYEWIERLISFAKKWRCTDRYFLIHMARCNDLYNNSCFSEAVRNVGTPIMSNNIKGVYYKIPPYGLDANQNNIEYLKAIYEIEKLFENGNTKCSMSDWCKNSPGVVVNNKCDTSPWEARGQNLCPYAFLWRHWNLTGKNPRLIKKAI